MNPILQFLDYLIRQHGEAIENLFVYVVIPLTAWLLGRRAGRKKVKQSHTFVLMIHPPASPPGVPPVIRWNFEPPDDGSNPFGN
jgi:ACR3 family arsenite efflux pump ArsB